MKNRIITLPTEHFAAIHAMILKAGKPSFQEEGSAETGPTGLDYQGHTFGPLTAFEGDLDAIYAGPNEDGTETYLVSESCPPQILEELQRAPVI